MITFGCSVKGAAHIRADMPCQDSHIIQQHSDYTILAVADGHGSLSCPFSQDGSKIAVQTFCDLMTSYYEKNSSEDLMNFLNHDGKIVIPKEIETFWKENVLNFHSQKSRDYPNNNAEEEIYKQYGSTLLGLLITQNFIYAFQLGDGDIICVAQDEVSPIINSDYLLGVETFSLSNKNAWKYSNITIISRTKNNFPNLYILSTDGFSNSHASQEDFYQTCRDYYELFATQQQDYVKENLEQWLNETSTEGCGDDITVAFAFEENGKEEFYGEKI